MIHAAAFGNDFTWGVAASAFQTEGAFLTDGKGLSIWDVFTSVPGKVAGGQNAKVSCDFYNRYVQDIIITHFLNCKNFRFSLSWPRIFPHGMGETNEAGLDFYDRVIDFCLEMDVEPWITLYHWDLPLTLEMKGGWTNREILNWFARYVETCALRYGDRVKNWMVLNEPLAFTGAGYFLGIHAPGKRGLNNFLPAAHHAVLCQALGGHVLKSVNKKLNVGTTFSCSQIEPFDKSEASVGAARRIDALMNRMFLEPLLGMGYPTRDLKILNRIEKFMHANDEKEMAFDMDFIGLQHYTREVVRYSPMIPFLQATFVKAAARSVPVTSMNWEIYPEGIYRQLKKFTAYPRIKNILVTENGAAFPDVLKNGSVHDEARIIYLDQYLQQVLKAKNEGVPVNGYFVWSLTDNFEWAEGYRQRFGLVYVDYATQKRIIKASGHWYRKFLSEVEVDSCEQVPH